MVFVLDKKKKPLMPCTEKRARLLLERRRAVVHRRYPFTIRLKDRVGGEVQPVRLKVDPGATVSGVALVRESCEDQHVLHLAEITHRGPTIRKHLTQRAQFRRRRRNANLRYRAPRFLNRTKPQGWLAPSLQSRADNVENWVRRYQRIASLTALSLETVRFDTQKLENPEIQGVEYQQGTLAGYELREYLLEKWGRKCAYCVAENVPLQVEHLVPRARGGSDRVSNLTLACEKCNRRKGSQPLEAFLADDPERLAHVLSQAKQPLASAAAVNATRNLVVEELQATGLTVELASGGKTKWNRFRFGIPKEHSLDAACVGETSALEGWNRPVLCIKACGKGSYQRTRLDGFGFPRGYLTRTKTVRGFQTGDLVRAVVPTGKKAGAYTGRVAVRASGSFNVQTPTGVIQGISWKHCTKLNPADGHTYHQERRARLLPTAKTEGIDLVAI